MIRICITSLLLLLFSLPAAAATYSWTDEKGTLHFTEDPGKIPEKIRSKAKILEETEITPEERQVPREPAAGAAKAATMAAPSGSNGDDGIYNGKTRDEWQKELTDRDTAMTAVRSRIDEIAAQLQGYTGSWEEQKKLMLEHNSLSARLKAMKAEYFQQVEKARKAGLQVNIEE